MAHDRRTTRVVVLSVLGVAALLVGAGLYLASFPDAERREAPREYVPSSAERAFADDPTPEELAEGELPAPRELDTDWPGAVDCDEHGRIVAARDLYNDVEGTRRRRSPRPSASLDLGAVRLARGSEALCLAWVARRPPRSAMVIDLEMREIEATAEIWAVRVALEPGRRFVSVSWPGVGFRPRPARLDVVRRYGRVVLPRSSMPRNLPDRFGFQVVSRSRLLRGGRSFLDCVPDALSVRYPAGSAVEPAPGPLCAPQP